MSASANPIDVVEAAYSLDGSDHAWLEALIPPLRPLIDDGLGLYAHFFDLAIPRDRWLDGAVVQGFDALGRAAFEGFMTAPRLPDNSTEADLARMYAVPSPLESLSDAIAAAGIPDFRHAPEFRALLDAFRGQEVVSFRTFEPCGKGIGIFAPHRERRSIDARTQHLWSRVSAHVAAGRRLRERLATSAQQAVLTPSGKLEHAEGEATEKAIRETLREAVVRQEKARGRRRREDPEGATELWTALVDGRWSLVDQFERDGRRFIVARRNEHGLTDPRGLAPRECDVAYLAALGKPNKLIAYELGIAESTVATHLSAAMRKLGASSRVDLLSILLRLPKQ